MIIMENRLFYICLSLTANAVRIYSVYRFVCVFFDRKRVSRLAEGLMFALYFLLNSAGFMVSGSFAVYTGTNILLCFLITCLYPGGAAGRLFFTGLVYCLNIGWDSLIGAAFFPAGNNLLTSGAFTSVCVLATEIVFERIYIFRFRRESPVQGKWRMLAVIPGISILLATVNYVLGFGTTAAVINLLGLLAIDFTVFHTYACLVNEQKNRYEAQLSEEQDRSYMQQSAIMEESVSSLRHFRHDVRMHWNALSAMIKEGRNEDALNYLSDIADIISPKWEISATGNRDLDCILNYEWSKAAEAGIRIDCNIAVPPVPLIKAYDLNTILVNLLDNAIEAAAQCEQKEICLIIRYIGGVLHISVSNPYTGTIQAEGNKILSKKPEPGLHGIGLESVRRAAGKYDGEAIFKYGDGHFTAIVDLFIQDTTD